MDRLGIDIGSKTIKVALVSGRDGTLLYSDCRRHRSQVKQALAEVVHDCIWHVGTREVAVTATGSAGMRVAELFSIPFVQEVVALRRAVEREQPGADAILEMGGEDTKLVYLTGVPEQRMNNICAGGTGGFIDMMASTMGVRPDDMDRLAQGASTIYPIASRCAVFAKSDVRPLVNAGARREDIAASVLRAVCTQAVAGLSAGRPLTGKVVLLGGPFRYIPALRDAFCAVTGIPRKDAVVPANAHLFVALGAAVSPECSAPIALDELEALVTQTAFEDEQGIPRLAPLFSDRADYDAFRKRHSSCRIPRSDASMRSDGAEKNLFLGIDAGSTTMKMALIDETGALRAYEYRWNRGDVNVSLPRWLKSIYDSFDARYDRETKLRRSLIVGYGEEYCKAAYRIDSSEVETVAHLRAATELDPEVDFLIDIGGQDIKCFYVHDGAITDLVLNEACSSGCGSLFDSTARSLGMTKETFAHEALFARAPVDLGTRCATFMDSRVKHAQKDGAALGDIAAGICYSTARNALYKVVRQPDFSKVGKHIVVTGGAFANDALLRAFELETKTQVSRPDLSEVMGAWGAALLARDEWLALRDRDPQAAEATESTILRREELERLDIQSKNRRCDLCTNHCELVVTRFFDGPDDHEGRLLVTGNRCERGAEAIEGAKGAGIRKRPPNMVRLKNALIAACDKGGHSGGSAPVSERPVPRVGIPKVLALYESYPFWRAFFDALGVPVVAGAPSDEHVYRAGMGNIPSESACYPSKLAYGHCVELARHGADLLFVPYLGRQFAHEGLLGLSVDASLRECPLVEELPAMLEGNLGGLSKSGASFCTPDLRTARSLDDAAGILARALSDAGVFVSRAELDEAMQRARAAYRAFFEKLQRANERVLARIDAGEFPGALLVGHPYHADPGVNHGIDELLGKMGYAVLERMDYGLDRPAEDPGSGDEDGIRAQAPRDVQAVVPAWTENRALVEAAQVSSAHPDLQFIVLRSFGCGVDALAADEVHDMLRRQGRVSAELKIDDIVDLAAVRIRVRSLAYAMRQRSGEVGVHRVYRDQPDGEAGQQVPNSASRHSAGQRPAGTLPMPASAPEGPLHARRPRKALADAMRSYGFTLTADGVGRLEPWVRAFLSVIVFSSDAGALEFSDWNEVDDYVTQRELGNARPAAGREIPADRLVEHMRELGYEREGRTAGKAPRRLLRFRSASERRPFASWGEVDKFVHQLRHAAGR